jgi:anthranilate 1,2-dioxygenase small subunit
VFCVDLGERPRQSCEGARLSRLEQWNLPMQLDSLSAFELDYHVQRLLASYVLCIDDDRLEEWPDYFTERCHYRIIARENAERGLTLPTMFCDSRGMLTDRVVSLRKANIFERHGYRHIVSATLVGEVRDNAVVTRSNYVVYRTRTNGVSELYSAGTYADRIVYDEAALRFSEKIVTYDTNRIDSLLATPL